MSIKALGSRFSSICQLAICATTANLMMSGGSIADECAPVRPESHTDQIALIERPGNHCVKSDFHQRWLYAFAEGGRRGPHASNLIEIWAKQVDLDLQNHTLKTSTYVDGIIGPSIDPKRVEFNRSGFPDRPYRLRIHSGVIKLRNSDGKNSGIGVVSPLEASYVHSTHTSIRPPSIFKKVEIVLENLTIKTGNTGALLMGEGIVVRNCTIEVDGPNALVIYGPNALIENNRIVYRHAPRTTYGLAEPTPGRPPDIKAAIYLRLAKGSTVRGNTIDVREDDGASAIALIDSTAVLIEENLITKNIRIATIAGRSSAELRRNRSIGGFFTPAEALPDATLGSGN